MNTFENVTIYVSGPFGYNGTPCKTLTIEPCKYAQYERALHVTFRQPRQRKDRGFHRCGSDRRFVVVAGVGLPEELTATFTEGVSTGTGFISRTTRHGCYAPEWETEFAEALDRLVAAGSVKVLYDGRSAL